MNYTDSKIGIRPLLLFLMCLCSLVVQAADHSAKITSHEADNGLLIHRSSRASLWIDGRIEITSGGFTDLAVNNLDAREKALQNLTEVQVATEDATNLIDGLLAFNREHPMQTVAIDLNALLGKFASMFERIVGEDITLTFVADRHVGQVLGDRALLEQVSLELVLNARDAMPDGGEIEVRTKRVTLDDDFELGIERPPDGRYATIIVSDTGAGIPEDILTKVFDPVFTTKEIGQGTGLGLSTVKDIVEQHQGEIIVTSTEGKGTRFVVYLPLLEHISDGPAVDTKEENLSERLGYS